MHKQLTDAWNKSGTQYSLDLERFYELLTWINGEGIEPPIPLQLSSVFPSRSRATELLLWELKKFVQARCLGFTTVDYFKPLADFARSFSPLTILSLNYDTCVETVLDRWRVSWTDGFPHDTAEGVLWDEPDFPPPDRKGQPLVRLVKLHGSASWYQTSPGRMKRGRGSSQHQIGLSLGAARTMTHEAMMVYPTLHKALADGPFPTLLATSQRSLTRSSLCIAIGYAFNDIHIRRLMLDALETQPHLRLVIVNPYPEPIIELLLRDAGSQSVRERIGVASTERDPNGGYFYGFVQNTLKDGWLLERCRKWLAGMSIESLAGMGTSAAPSGSRPWEVRVPIQGGVGCMVRRGDNLTFVARKTKEIQSIDLGTGRTAVLSREFVRPRGLALDQQTGTLYVVENLYRLGRGNFSFSIPRGGIGRLWALSEGALYARPLTGLRLFNLLRTAGNLARTLMGKRQLAKEDLWRLAEGALRWPVSVIVERSGESLLLTEAPRLRRLNLRTGELELPLSIPLCTNLGNLVLEGPDTVLLTDAGIYPRGRGRLMRGDLRTGTVELLAEGWELLGSIAVLPKKSLILLAIGSPSPAGRVIALDHAHPDRPPVLSWLGLNRPGALCPSENEESILVSTADGIAELRL